MNTTQSYPEFSIAIDLTRYVVFIVFIFILFYLFNYFFGVVEGLLACGPIDGLQGSVIWTKKFCVQFPSCYFKNRLCEKKCFSVSIIQVLFHSRQVWGGTVCHCTQSSNTHLSYCDIQNSVILIGIKEIVPCEYDYGYLFLFTLGHQVILNLKINIQSFQVVTVIFLYQTSYYNIT